MRIPFGRTGVMVSRMGLASGFGVPTAAIEKAFHEYGVNYFYMSFLNRRNMVRAVHNLGPGQRDELFIVLANFPTFSGGFVPRTVDRWLRRLKVERVAAVLLQDGHKRLGPKLAECAHRLTESGKVRFVGISSHDRPLFGAMARGEVEAPVDFFQIRYNAVHSGAEQDIFPHLPQENRPGIVIFTATSWGQLLKPKLLPEGERPVDPADCYRFVLSHPDVNVCVTGPKTAAQMEDNLKALAAGPLDEEEMARMRRIGKHIYGKKGRGPLVTG
jgi:aryl-alcohol dehydrogenase-like predicted oxidoreductase